MSFLGEIKRRKVFQVAAVYAVVAWLLIQIVATIEEPLNLPNWVDTLVIVLLAIGFPITLIISWAFNLTPEGVVRDHGSASATQTTGRRIEFVLIGLLVIAVGWLAYRDIDSTGVVSTGVDAARRSSVAVLPFDNRSARVEDKFFVDGIHDDILSQLAKIGALKVISRTSVMEYRDSTKNLRQIGQELDVATILEGGVQRAGDSVRINVQLIDAATDEHIWAEIYDRELKAENIFAIQSEIARSIAEALQTELTPQELAHLSEVPSKNTQAYDFYLIGKEYQERGNLALAEQMYQRAVEEDPQFALAWADLGHAHIRIYWQSDPTEARRQTAFEAISTALELSPGLPEGHVALGQYYYRGFRDYDRALQEYRIAERTMRGDGRLIMRKAFVQRRVGQWEEALESMERAIELAPRDHVPLRMQARTYMALGNYVEAERYIERAREIAPDDGQLHIYRTLLPIVSGGDTASARAMLADPLMPHESSYHWLGWLVSVYEKNYGAAIEHLEKIGNSLFVRDEWFFLRTSLFGETYRLTGALELARERFQAANLEIQPFLASAPDDARIRIALGEILAGLGEREAAVAAAQQAMEMLSPASDTLSGPEVQIDAVVRILVPAQAHDAAIRELDAYLSGPGYWTIEGLLPDPRLDPIRDDPRFQELVEKYRR